MNRLASAALLVVGLLAASLSAACVGGQSSGGQASGGQAPSAQEQSPTEQPQPTTQGRTTGSSTTESSPTEQPQPTTQGRTTGSSTTEPSPTEQPQPTTTEQPTQAETAAQEEPSETTSPPPASDPPEQQQEAQRDAAGDGNVALAVERILDGRAFEQPIELSALPDGSLLIAEQRGSITRYIGDEGGIEQVGVLDLTDRVRFGGENGLLSFALHPDLQSVPYIYVYYSLNDANATRLSRFRIVQGAALLASELVIMEIAQPYANHNGGAVRFGPDGMLYLGLGDGGAAGDPQGHGQNRETLLGSIIRIDVADIDTSTPYRIPTDNPFLGVADVRPEIWAYGLRNPWRMTFDVATGDLWVGDVGQDRLEEIALVRAGENHGWNVFEGSECFRSPDQCDALENHTPPIAVVQHPSGCSVTGGVVYRGAAIPELSGHYIFGDYCAGIVWSIAPDGVVTERLQLDEAIASFGVDLDGEVYILVFRGPLLKLVTAQAS